MDRAEALLSQILEVSPGAVHALMLLADIRRRRGDRAAAEQFFRQAWEIDPNNLKAGIGLVRLLLFRKSHSDAGKLLRQILADAPRHPDALVLLAELHRSTDDTAVSEVMLRQSLADDPAQILLTLALARRLAEDQHHSEAEAPLRAALDIMPEHPELLVALGKVQVGAGQYDAALLTFDRACRLPVPFPAAWIERSRLVFRLFSAKEGLALLTQGIDACGAVPKLQHELAIQLLDGGHIAEADRIVAAAVQCAPDHAELMALGVRIHILKGRHTEAERALKTLPAETRKARRVRTRLKAALLKARWRISDALFAYGATTNDDGFDPEDHRAIAQMHLMALDVASARQALKQSLPRNARTPDARIPKGLPREIANDFWSNPSALTAGRKALAAASLPTWIDTLRTHSRHTGCAIGFLIHLRQSGRLSIRPPAKDGDAIPLHIHQFWNEPELPEDVAELVDSWRTQNFGFQHSLLSQQSVRAWLAQRDVRWRQALRNIPSIAGKTDLLRLALLYEQGGVYVDADDRCVAPLGPLLAGRDLILRQEHCGTVGNNFIAARPRHPVIGLAFQEALDAALRGDRESIWLATGPGLLTRVLAGWLAAEPGRLDMIGRHILILDQHILLRYCASNCKANYKHSASNWRVSEFRVPTTLGASPA